MLLAVAAALALPLASCTSETPRNGPRTASPGNSAASPSLGRPGTVADRLEAPWSIAFHGDTPLVSERDSGRILELDRDGEARAVGKVGDARPMGEGGLLGLAVHKGHLYAYYTAIVENRIERYEIKGRPGSLRLGPPRKILDGIPAASFHNGGRLAFGPDGMLYATVGDAGVEGRAQDRRSLAGKILRLTPEGRVPDDNPFPGSPVYSYGHRNPQGLAWDDDGTLYAAEFGQDTWDELNVIEAGGNYGWPEVEGIAKKQDKGKGKGDGKGAFVDPVQQWRPVEASPSGIAIAGSSLYIANLRGERLREVPLAEPGTYTEHFTRRYGRLRDVVTAPDGTLWVLTNNTDGRGDPGPDDDRVLRVRVKK